MNAMTGLTPGEDCFRLQVLSLPQDRPATEIHNLNHHLPDSFFLTQLV